MEYSSSGSSAHFLAMVFSLPSFTPMPCHHALVFHIEQFDSVTEHQGNILNSFTSKNCRYREHNTQAGNFS
jgi:hypothetical protein